VQQARLDVEACRDYEASRTADRGKSAMAKIASGKDLLMFLLYAKGHRGQTCEPIRGRTRLMKAVFLFEKEVKQKFARGKASEDDLPKFQPDSFGPFSPQVFSDLEFLVDAGFVEVKEVAQAGLCEEELEEYRYWQATEGGREEEGEPAHAQDFCLTPLGKEFVESELARALSVQEWSVLDAFKARCTGAPLRAILRYVYTKYPQTTTKSRIRDEILRKHPY
jgi:uncharacterized protein YwgA